MPASDLSESVDVLSSLDVGRIIGILTTVDEANKGGTGTLSDSAKREISKNTNSFISMASRFYQLVSGKDEVFAYLGAKTTVEEGKTIVRFIHPENLGKIDSAAFKLRQVRDQFRSFLRDRLEFFSKMNPGVSKHTEQRFLSDLLQRLDALQMSDTKVLSDIKVWRNVYVMGESAFH